jgi:hypothetical protein
MDAVPGSNKKNNPRAVDAVPGSNKRMRAA